ncbi:hypothetical protein CBR_g37860 [Chara braunii]|uniref:Uncharacterized protein n=1 Tax=Chara braunii TaxID=69332 RepID=A0A388LNU5_CHABU|nr:hypothetical protein CBR_g37860 [Chara braunii]|eukprot:GBG83988.1 hypothetical protein CBR_g37860 [Chara braunii]
MSDEGSDSETSCGDSHAADEADDEEERSSDDTTQDEDNKEANENGRGAEEREISPSLERTRCTSEREQYKEQYKERAACDTPPNDRQLVTKDNEIQEVKQSWLELLPLQEVAVIRTEYASISMMRESYSALFTELSIFTGCGYVLPWQRGEGIFDAQAGLEVEHVWSGTRSGMTEEEIEEQAALITRDPIRSSGPPAVESVFGARVAIFRPYPREDASNDGRQPEAADDPTLPIPCKIDELHEEGNEDDERAHTAWAVAKQTNIEMMGGKEEFWGSFRDMEERSLSTAREHTPPCVTLCEETPAPTTAREEPRPTTTAPGRTTVPITAQEQAPAPTTTWEQTSTLAMQFGPSSPLPLPRDSIGPSAQTALIRHAKRSAAPVGREDLGSSLHMRGHGSLFSVARHLVLEPHALGDLGKEGVHNGALMVEERERRAEEHGAGGVEGIRGMEEEVAGVESEEAMMRVHDGEQVEREEGMLPTQVEREEDVVRTQVERDEDVERVDDSAQVQREEGVVGGQVEREEDVVRTQVEREEDMAGVDDDLQVEIEEDVVRADVGALVEGEEGVVGGDVAHGRGEGSDNLDPIVQHFIADEMGLSLEGLTPGMMMALEASPSGGREASGMRMRDFMEMSLGDPPSPCHAEREDTTRALAVAGYSLEEIEQAFTGCEEV